MAKGERPPGTYTFGDADEYADTDTDEYARTDRNSNGHPCYNGGADGDGDANADANRGSAGVAALTARRVAAGCGEIRGYDGRVDQCLGD